MSVCRSVSLSVIISSFASHASIGGTVIIFIYIYNNINLKYIQKYAHNDQAQRLDNKSLLFVHDDKLFLQSPSVYFTTKKHILCADLND